MSVPGRPIRPPEWADALLQRCLPDGVVGLTILGDLHQEFEELTGASALRTPRLWYIRAALALCARYAFVRFKAWVLEGGSSGSRAWEMMMTWFADLRFGFRMLLKTPLVSGIAVLTVALGVALTTHTFSSVHGSILRGIPVPDDERLMFVGAERPDLGISEMELSVHEFEDVRAQQTSFDDLAGFYQGTVNLAGDERAPERFAGAYVSDNFFEHLGVPPQRGRTFYEGEDDPDAPLVMVLGHHVWQNRFGGDPGVLGSTVRVNGQTAEVVGIMPEGFRFPFLEDVWVPHRMDVAALPRGAGQDLDTFGRVREGLSLDAARTELKTIAGRLRSTYPETAEEWGLTAKPYADRFMPQEIQAVLWVMLTATFGVLLIACANVANLLMARASIRRREIAVRTALGAGRWRVVRQLMLESLALAVFGGVLGVVIAWFGVEVYRTVLADIYKPYWIDFRMDLPVLVFSLAVSLVASVAAGAIPALRASGIGMGEVLKDAGRGSSSLSLGRLSHILVVTEIAVSCALLVGAGFMIRSVINLKNVDLGFEAEGIMTGRVGLFEADYPDHESRDQFFTALREELEGEPGVRQVALTMMLPGLGGPRYFLSVGGETYATDRDHPAVATTVVTEDYFETLGVPVTQGRAFTSQETRLGGDPVVIVNESFAERYLADTPVLGEQIRLGRSESTRPWLRVVGVVPDMHIGGNVGGIGDDRVAPEQIFLPQGSLDVSFMSVVLRTDGEPVALSSRLREAVARLDPNLPVYDLAPLGQAVRDATWAFGLFGSLFTIFGAAALFLASVGLYGVMAFGVSQRRREMGVRMALGADGPAIVRMILGRGTRQLALGMAIGLVLGAGMSQSMTVILYGVETGDPVVYGSIVVALGLTGLLACLVPARAATRADPIQAMRMD